MAGRPPGAKDRPPADRLRAFFRSIVGSREYRRSLRQRAVAGKLPASVETALIQIGYQIDDRAGANKPETIQITLGLAREMAQLQEPNVVGTSARALESANVSPGEDSDDEAG